MNHLKIRFLSSLLGLLLIPTFCFGSPVDFPGLISMTSEKQQASDIVFQGRSLIPDEVSALIRKGQDVSLLEPVQTSDLWRNSIAQPLNLKSYTLGLPEEADYHFLANVISRVGNFRFTVSLVDANGVNRNYVVLTSKQMHNVLLRKALLEKLGYVIPAMQFVPKMKVRFAGAFSRKEFIDNLRNNTFGDPERWVLDLKDTQSDSVTMQDVLILSADDHIYDLALGTTTSGVIQGRRLLNALLVPYNLVDVPESLMIFQWTTARVANEGIYLPFEGAEEFNPSFEDAKWMTRKIAQLSRNDIAEIVASAKLPVEVGMLLVEKIISRRNFLIQAFGLNNAALNYDPQISYGTLLVAGKLSLQNWPGYASRFSFGDPVSPLSAKEVAGFFRSKVYSSTIENLLVQFNNLVLPHTDIPLQIYNHQVDNAVKQIGELVNTGTVHRIPFGMYHVPHFSGHLIASREIVIGSYLGTDNLVQIADSFGFQVTAGVFIGFDGIQNPNLLPSAQVGSSFTRTYTHIKPIKSIVGALREPYSNMIVPLFKRNLAKIFDPLFTWDDKSAVDVQQKLLSDIMNTLSKSMATGDSLIITDSVNVNVGLSATYSLAQAVATQARISDSEVVIRRIQIYKKDENTIQIYRDPGDVNTFAISFGIGVHGVQLLSLGFSREVGHVHTDFFKLNIDPDLKRNPDARTNLISFRQLLLENSLEMIESKQNPFQLSHVFKENSTDLGLFYFKDKSLTTSDKITAIDPKGYKKSYLYQALATRTGKDYEALAVSVLQAYLQYRAGRNDVYIDDTTSGNPGDSFLGSSVSRRVSFEAELLNQNANSPLGESFANISQTHKGWNISKSEAKNILETFNNQYGTQLFWPDDLNSTTAIQLYMIDLEINIYQDGIDFLMTIPADQVKKLFAEYAHFPKTPLITVGRDSSPSAAKTRMYHDSLLSQFLHLQEAYLAESRDGRSTQAARDGAALISLAEILFPGKYLVNLVGGPDNIFIQGRINGFRKNDQAGETPLISKSIGVVGSRKVNGPLRFVQTNLEMSESEFFLYWLMNRI